MATLLLAGLFYAWSVLSLNALAAADRWLDPSSKARDRAADPKA